MRARKLLKISAISLGSLAVLLLFLVAFFLFNPFEGSLAEMRDIVPRNVDFFAHKAGLTEDFETVDGSIDTDQFPYVPSLEEIGGTSGWVNVKRGAWFRDLGLQKVLADVRVEFERLRKDLSFLHLVDDVLGREIQVAGYFGPNGFDDATWCAYARVSWRGKAVFGAMAQSFVREEMGAQGITVTDDSAGFYKLNIKGQPKDLFLSRFRDCLMVANDRELLANSMEMAAGNRQDHEPLGTSAHYKDGVLEPMRDWKKLTEVANPNVLELHLLPDNLLSKLPEFRNWPSADNDENRNEKILASFVNLDSFRFLSGSLIFEPYSLSVLSHLVVNNSLLSPFQKKIFTDQGLVQRDKWMNQFFKMVPRDACAAAALRVPAGDFLREMFKDAFVLDERDEIDRAVKAARGYQGVEDLITRMELNLRPRMGVILRPNERSMKSKEIFKVHAPSALPQWAWVFWVKKARNSSRVLNEPFKKLINHVNENRRAFAISSAFRLALSKGGVKSDVAFEFAIPAVAGTGSIAAATMGEYFIVSNSGPFIKQMVDALVDRKSRWGDDDFNEFEKDMPDAVNGVVFAWADQLKKVAADMVNAAKNSSGTMDPQFGLDFRPRAEGRVFRNRKWSQYVTKAKIPADQKPEFDREVDDELDKMWIAQKKQQDLASVATLEQFRHFVGTFRSAYLQMVLDEDSLKVWGRVLAPEYGK